MTDQIISMVQASEYYEKKFKANEDLVSDVMDAFLENHTLHDTYDRKMTEKFIGDYIRKHRR